MSKTWVVDLHHHLTSKATMAPMPSRAQFLDEFFASIVVDATMNVEGPPTVRCRHHAGHRPCTGIVLSWLNVEHDNAIVWHCPVCRDNGIIRGWQNALRDGFACKDPPASCTSVKDVQVDPHADISAAQLQTFIQSNLPS